jgi:hypothetical protein
MGFHITWMLFTLPETCSRFCKDGLMMVNWQEHVVKIKIKIYWCVLTEIRNYFIFYFHNGLSLKECTLLGERDARLETTTRDAGLKDCFQYPLLTLRPSELKNTRKPGSRIHCCYHHHQKERYGANKSTTTASPQVKRTAPNPICGRPSRLLQVCVCMGLKVSHYLNIT